LEEVMEVADRIAVMRDGELEKILPKEEATMEEIIRLMVGRDMGEVFPVRKKEADLDTSRVILKVNKIGGGKVLNDIHFEVRQGEILGIAGLEGSGRTDMAEAIIGRSKPETVDIEFDGKPFKPVNPRLTYANGISYVAPERRVDSVFPTRSVKENIVITSLQDLKSGVAISGKKMDALSDDYVKKLKIKVSDPEQLILSLSGGNQQKAIISRALATKPKLLILNEPTRGIDVGAKYEIYSLIHQLANEGLAIILISSEINEILGMSERIVAFWEGDISGEFSDFQDDPNIKEKVLNAIMGGKAQLGF